MDRICEDLCEENGNSNLLRIGEISLIIISLLNFSLAVTETRTYRLFLRENKVSDKGNITL